MTDEEGQLVLSEIVARLNSEAQHRDTLRAQRAHYTQQQLNWLQERTSSGCGTRRRT